VNKFPVAVFVRKQTGRPCYYVVAFEHQHVVEPDAVCDQSLDVRAVQSVRVVAPAWKVSVLRRREFGSDTVHIQAPGAVPPGYVVASSAGRPRQHSSVIAEHLLVRLSTTHNRNWINVTAETYKVYVYVDLYSAFFSQSASNALRHGSHSFTCKLHHVCLRTSPPFGWYSFYRPMEGRRLSRPGWLVTYRN